MRNGKSNREAYRPRDLTYCSHKPECIVTTNPDWLELTTIITRHFQFHHVNINVLHLKYEYGARGENCFACYFHSYVKWCRLTPGIVASKFPSATDTCNVLPQTFDIGVFKTVKTNLTTVGHIHSKSATMIEGCNVALDANDCYISYERCRWLARKVRWHALAFVTHQIK